MGLLPWPYYCAKLRKESYFCSAMPRYLNYHPQTIMEIISAVSSRIRYCVVLTAVVMCAAVPASPQVASTPMVRWGDEQADTIKLASVCKTLYESGEKDRNRLTLLAARQFIGVPYVAGTLESPTEMLAVSTSGLDCTTLVELSMALAKSVADGGDSWRDALYNLRDIRYRGGVVDGYASRLHYISDWITDNTYRRNIREVTSDAPRAKAQVASVNFMTAHRDKYPPLADQATYDKIRDMERRLHRVKSYYIPKAAVSSREVRDFIVEGDVVFITTSIEGLDVSHAGVIFKDEMGVPHLLHASTTAGKVIEDSLSLADYLARQKKSTGIRIVRLR